MLRFWMVYQYCKFAIPFRICMWGLLISVGVNPISGQETPSRPWDTEVKLDQIQMVGTHNSYHLAPEPELMSLIATASQRAAQSIDYSHLPIPTQLTDLGIRQLELDVYADPAGGLFSKPIGMSILGKTVNDPRMDFDFDSIMAKPGMKIIHSPGFDYATTVPTLILALGQIKAWSDSNPTHLPIMVLVELKQDTTGPAGVKAIPFDADLLKSVDDEIRSIVPAEQMLTPDDVRGDYASLRDAILERGWPTLEKARGKLLFALDNEGALMEKYLADHPGLEGRVMFASVPEAHVAAAFMKINDPVRDFDRIRSMVEKGFLVRTRADSETKQSRENNPAQRDKALASGAQFVSTDYPIADQRFSEYSVRLPGGIVARLNPVSAPAKPDWVGLDLESR